MQELADKIWSNPRFHSIAARMQRAWIAKQVGANDIDAPDAEDTAKLIEASAALACSNDLAHRQSAYRAVTSSYELYGATVLPLDQAVRVVLGRLGNFPAIQTRQQVAAAQPSMPTSLLAEELAASDLRTVTLPGRLAILTDFQHEFWTKLKLGRRLAVAAPTSAGKSYVLQSYLASLFADPAAKSVLYIVPTRALITQVSKAIREEFAIAEPNLAPVVATVPVEAALQLPNRAVYVMTQERAQIMLAAHADFAADVIVVDEAHGVADGSRGVRLQAAMEELLGRNPSVQVLFASPGVRNLEVFGRMLGVEDIESLRSREPTVAQNFIHVHVANTDRGEIQLKLAGAPDDLPSIAAIQVDRRTVTRVERLTNVAFALGRGATNIIYANGAAEAEEVAIALSALVGPTQATPARTALRRIAAESVHAEYALVQCVMRGVAFHYSNMPTQLRLAIEQAVARGDIDYLVCTSTLLQGVNLPARNIFMFKPEKGSGSALRGVDFWNLAGRAGRLLKEFQGNIFLVDYDRWANKPLEQAGEADIIPAVDAGVLRQSKLLDIVNRSTGANVDDSDLEAVFVQLLGKLRDGSLSTTLARIAEDRGLPESASTVIERALEEASILVKLPQNILRRSPDISAHKQQMLYNNLAERLANSTSSAALIPKHPKDWDAYQSYADALHVCHRVLLGLAPTSKFHNFIALIALWWMQGRALPRIVQNQLERNVGREKRLVVRETLELVEKQVRFQCVRLLGCYHAVLGQLLIDTGQRDAAMTMPDVVLYLEMGAADRTTISLMSLGISRPTATRLAGSAPSRNLDLPMTLTWLGTLPTAISELSATAREEVESVVGRTSIGLP